MQYDTFYFMHIRRPTHIFCIVLMGGNDEKYAKIHPNQDSQMSMTKRDIN